MIRRTRLGRAGRLLVALALLPAAAGFTVLTSAGAASACVADTDGDCWRPNYQTQRTDGSLAVWSGPGTGQITSWLGGNGTQVEVDCETTGTTEDGLPYVVWDHLDDGGYVYGYYLNTPGDGYTPALTRCAGPPPAPPAPSNVVAVPYDTADGATMYVTWTGHDGNTAKYAVANGNTASPDLAAGTYAYRWGGLSTNQYTCFTVTAKWPGAPQSPWAPWGCASTWCPTGDTTSPTCDTNGAFQRNYAYPKDDYKTATPDTNILGTGSDDLRMDLGRAAEAYMATNNMIHAQQFLGHYLDGSCSDYNYSTIDAYMGAPGFQTAVNATAAKFIAAAKTTDTIDTGWADFPHNDANGNPTSTAAWGADDWKNAVGHGFYRLTGTYDGTFWNLRLQLTSFYQFNPNGPDLHGVSQADMRRLEQIGWACNYKEKGDGQVRYYGNGSPF